jgi:cell volume regulation protein A
MAVGLAIGPAFGLITPTQLGDSGPIFTTITLILILFRGGTRLNINVLINKTPIKKLYLLPFYCFK